MMYAKAFKAIWLFSLLGLTVLFLYIYASLPEEMELSLDIYNLRFSRNAFFYVSLVGVALINGTVFFARIASGGQGSVRVWLFGQLAAFNIFFAVAMGLVKELNSGERFAYERIGVFIYGSVALTALWALGGLAYFLFKKYVRM